MPGPAACLAQVVTNDHYPPFFTVDITDLADPIAEADLYNTSRGEAMDVNNDGFAVGWFTNPSSNDWPFFMTPVDGGSASKLQMDSGFTFGQAIGMSETDGYDLTNAIIVGWAERPSAGANGHEAVYWKWNPSTLVWDFNVIPVGSADVIGEAQAVTDSGQIAGFFINSNNVEQVFFYDPFIPAITFPPSTRAMALAARDDDMNATVIAGIFMAGGNPPRGFYLNNGSGEDLHAALVGAYGGSGYTDSRARGMSGSGGATDNIVGFGNVGPTSTDAVYWWRDSTAAPWEVAVLTVPSPDPIDAMGTAINDPDTNDYVDLVDDYQLVGTNRGAFYVTLKETSPGVITYWSYRLDATTGLANDHPPLTMFPLAVRNGTTTAKTWTGNGINNTSSLAGSYKPDSDLVGDDNYLPCLFVPNDFDNDGVPDIREILQGSELDVNENWIIDSAENMRVGLFGPGGNASGGIGNVQVVRLMRYGQDKLNNIAASGPECANAVSAFDDWGFTWKNEIILNSRSVDPNKVGDHNKSGQFDILLDSGANMTSIDGAQNRADISAFAFRFARCIDGLQFGNEIFTGPGRYFFNTGDLPHSGLTGDIKDANTPKKLNDAMAAIFAQLGGQGEAARIGSALAGRPLRIFGPSVSLGMTQVGFCGTADFSDSEVEFNPNNDEDRSATAIAALVNFTNKHYLIFDQHLNFTSVAELQETVGLITNTAGSVLCASVTQAPWGDGPNFVATLEIGPMPTKNWWLNGGGRDEAFDHYGTNACIPVSNAWVDFVTTWKNADLPVGFEGSFHLDTVFDAVAAKSFRYLCVNTTQQGPKFDNDGEAISLSRTEMGTLRASEVDSSCLLGIGGDFMPIVPKYLSAAQDYWIDPFTPHPLSCDSNLACPQ